MILSLLCAASRTRGLALLVLLLLFSTVQPARAQRAWPTATPLGTLVEPDGTLKQRTGFTGSLDARGWRLTTDANGHPRFLADGDERWDDRFGRPGLGFYLYTAALGPTGDLYVGGYFDEAGGLPANYVARWDGRRWHPLGDGLDGSVSALAVAADGTVYAGGDFTKAGAFSTRGIARWDGRAWLPLGTGLETTYGSRGSAKAIAILGNDVYVGGSFARAGDADAVNLARWNGTAWSDVGGGVGSINYEGTFRPDGTVHTLVAADGALYVGGSFQATPAGVANSIARWDGAAWTALGAGLGGSYEGAYGTVYAIAVEGATVYAGGQFDKAGAVNAKNLARWDGAAWRAVGGGVRDAYGGGQVHALALQDGALYVGGAIQAAGPLTVSYVARWDGTDWANLDGGTSSTVKSILAAPTGGVYVGGDFQTAGSSLVNYLARWDGTRWHALGEGINYNSINGSLSAVAVGPTGEVYVGGYLTHAGGDPAQNVAVWDGTNWSALGEGVEGTVHALLIAGQNLYVGGDFTKAGGQSANHIARWNIAGRAWAPLASGVNGTVYALAHDGNNLYVGGDFSAAGTVDAEDVAIWNGTAWSKFGAGAAFGGGTVYALALDGPNVFVGGSFNRIKAPGMADYFPGVNALVMWSPGTDAWFNFGKGLTKKGTYSDYAGTVYALAATADGLYVGGDFDKAGETAANRIALLDPIAGWMPLGSAVGGGDQTVKVILPHGRAVYVGGEFQTAGGQATNYLARWDGAAWTPLGSGITLDSYDDGVTALAIRDDALYVGGDFAAAGGKPAASFARWTLQDAPGPTETALIAVDPLRVDFGEVTLGQPEVLMITVANDAAATGTLNGTVGTPTGPFTLVEGGGAFSLAPGASREVIVQFDPVAVGPVNGTLAITHNAGNAARPLTVTLTGQGKATDGVPRLMTLRNFDPRGPQMAWTVPDNGGFVFGTNKYGDRAKATVFTVPAGKTGATGQVTEVNIWFAYKKAGLTNETYTLHLYNGDAATGPIGAPLYSETHRLADVKADADPATPEEPTLHPLARPVTVGSSFFVSVDFGAYTDQQLAAVAAGEQLARRVPEVWEQDRSGAWANVSDAWFANGNKGWQMWAEATVAVASLVDVEDEPELPARIALAQNYPNPFNPATTITYDLPAAAPIRLTVYDVTGRQIRTLLDGMQPAGTHEVRFEASGLPSGVYYYRLEAGSQTHIRQMILVK